jgi:hypothetical protein
MKKYLFASAVMLALIFLWWFSGGTIWGYQRPAPPAEKALAFVWENFNYGLATIFDAIGNLLR